MSAQTLHKILFIGPMGAGKTTAIAAISDTPPITSEAENSDVAQAAKATTTVAMDYGSIELKDDVIHLYGIPGQHRFRFMWPILAMGAVGGIILVDDTRENPFEDLDLYLEAFQELISQQAFVVGIGRTDKSGASLDKYTTYVAEKGMCPPIFEIDVRDRGDVVMMLEILLINLEMKS
ncbi:MAG: ATP/GTP-binding protein [Neisseriaceae bacterium]|nr:ATP/GTP-binding protein [Neisseriaceae bacterium]